MLRVAKRNQCWQSHCTVLYSSWWKTLYERQNWPWWPHRKLINMCIFGKKSYWHFQTVTWNVSWGNDKRVYINKGNESNRNYLLNKFVWPSNSSTGDSRWLTTSRIAEYTQDSEAVSLITNERTKLYFMKYELVPAKLLCCMGRGGSVG